MSHLRGATTCPGLEPTPQWNPRPASRACWRLGATLVALSLVCATWAQTSTQGTAPPVTPPTDPAGTTPSQDQTQKLPNQPQGFPNPQTKGNLPPPEAGSENDPFIQIVRGNGGSHNGKLVLKDGVEILYRGYQLFADRLEGDENTNVYVASGNVRLYGKDESIVGDSIQVDFNNNTFVATDSAAVVHPSLIGPDAKADVFLRGGRTYGSRRRIFGENTSFTTCDKEKPHFELVAQRTDLRPGKRVILSRVHAKLFGRTIATIPFLSIPLNQPNYKYMPEVGYTDQLGYYIKTRFGLYNRGRNNLDGRAEYYSKLGLGTGLDYDYASRNNGGYIHFFNVQGPQPVIDFSQDHKQNLGWGRLDIQNSYERTNFINAPNNTTLNTHMDLLIPQGKSSTDINFFRTSNDTNTYNSINESMGIVDNRVFNSRLKTQLSLTYIDASSSFSQGSPVKRQEFDVRFRGDEDLSRANLELIYQRNIPIGDTANFFSSSDLTPVIALNTTSQKLFDKNNRFYLPFTTEMSFGQYADPVTKGEITRTDYNFRFSHTDPATKRLRFEFNGKFDQGIYSDNTAQYVLNAFPTLTYRFGRDTAATIRYAYMRPYGFTPLQIDRTGETNLFSADISFRPQRYVLLAGQTGYDFMRLQQHQPTSYQQVSLRAEFQPEKWFALRSLSTYDPILGGWSNLRFDLAYRPGSTFVSAGANYDGVRKTWAALNIFVDGFKWGRLKFSTILNYNGYLKEFEARHFQFTYDLHCAEAVLTILDNPIGFNSGRQVSLFVRLKAFPFESPFGIGTQGQPLGTGTGSGF